MFELEFSQTEKEKNLGEERLSVFKKIIEPLADIVSQIEIKCSTKGLSVQVMDSMHVGMAEVFLSNDFFKLYRCDRDIQLGVPIKSFLTILKGISFEDTSVVRFSCEDDAQVLRITHTLPNAHYDFAITLYTLGNENFVVPHIDYTSVIKMPSEKFRSISKAIGSFGDYISLECVKDSIIFKQSADMLKNTMRLKSDNEEVFVDSSEDTLVEISMKYVNLVNKVSVLGPMISVSLGDSAPVFFEIDIFGMGYFRFYVAPKAQD